MKRFTFLRETVIGAKVFDAGICGGDTLVTEGCRGSAMLNLTDACLDVTRSLIVTSTIPAMIEGTLILTFDLNPYEDGNKLRGEGTAIKSLDPTSTARRDESEGVNEGGRLSMTNCMEKPEELP